MYHIKYIDCFGQYSHFNNIDSSKPGAWDVFPFLWKKLFSTQVFCNLHMESHVPILHAGQLRCIPRLSWVCVCVCDCIKWGSVLGLWLLLFVGNLALIKCPPPALSPILPWQHFFAGTRRGVLSTRQDTDPAHPSSCCLSSVPTSMPGTHGTPFVTADICSLCLRSGGALRKVKLQKSCFLYCQALFFFLVMYFTSITSL